jgi:hypothetical protein
MYFIEDEPTCFEPYMRFIFRDTFEVGLVLFKTDVPEDEPHIRFETCWFIFNEIHVLNNRK